MRGDSNFIRSSRNEDDDEEDDYESDFENESYKQDDEEEPNTSGPYFIDFESKYNKSASSKNTKQVAAKVENESKIPTDNPLLSNNKYFFLKQELQKDIKNISSEHTSKDLVLSLAFKFIKKLSTFIDLATIE